MLVVVAGAAGTVSVARASGDTVNTLASNVSVVGNAAPDNWALLWANTDGDRTNWTAILK